MYVCLYVSVCLLCTKHEYFRKSDLLFVFQIVFIVIMYCCTCNAFIPRSSTSIYKAIVTLEIVLILFFRVLYNNLVLSLIYVKHVNEWMRVLFIMGHILLILCQFCLNLAILFCF